MVISDRLNCICLLIPDGSNVYDVGCDHGLLDIYLTLYKNCSCEGIDVSQEIINRAYNNFLKYNLNDSISLRVGNGFSKLDLEFDSYLVLAGMGTSTILKILKNNLCHDIIIQTNTDLFELRKNLCNLEYYIKNENIIFSNNRYYITIHFSLGKVEYSKKELLLGPCLIKENSLLFNNYLKYLYKKNINGYKKAISNGRKDEDLEFLINSLFEYIK